MNDPTAPGTPRKRRRPWLRSILAATFVVHAPALWGGFTNDDVYQAKAMVEPGRPNVMVAELRPIFEYFESAYWHGNLSDDELYRPVTVLSYALTHAALGNRLPTHLEAFPHRLGNVLLHLLAVWLVFQLVRRIVTREAPALVAALVFALHALHSEAVASIIGRADLFAFCFGALGLLVLERRRSLWRLPVATLCFFLAFCSKESAVAWLPFTAVWAWLRGWPRRQALGGIATALVPLAAFLMLRAEMIAGLPEGAPAVKAIANPLVAVDPGTRLLSGTRLLGYGLLQTLLPHRLVCFYGPRVFDPVTSVTDPWLLVAVAALACVLVAGLWRPKERPLLFLAAASFFGFAFVTSNLPFPIGVDFAERLYYAPSLALSFAIALLIDHGRAPKLLVLALVPWLAWSAATTVERCLLWRSNETLFLNDVTVQPRSCYLHLGAGNVLATRGEWLRAARHFATAARLCPKNARAWANLGLARLRAGHADEAERTLRAGLAALGEDPDPEAAKVHSTLGSLLLQEHRIDEARHHHETAFHLDPKVANHRANYLEMFRDELEPAKLLEIVARGEHLSPGDPRWPFYRGYAYLRAGRRQDAADALRRLLREPAAPRPLRQRAQELLRQLGG